jgi:hypothetical protein
MPTPGLSISYDIGRGRLPVDTGRARRQRRETFANPVAPRRAAPGRAHRVRLILRLPGLTELRLSVPETGKRLLPLPVAVWHKTVGKATDSICPKSAAEHPLKLRDQAKADEVVGVILNVHEQFGKPSGLGLTIAGRVRRPKWTSSSVTGIRWRWSGWSVLRNAWPSCSMMRQTRASKPDGYLLGS